MSTNENKSIEDVFKESDAEFLEYHFTDMEGNVRAKTVTKESVKGEGYSSVDGSSVFGKIIPPTESDMLLIPDPSTVAEIPWDKEKARVICDVYHPPEKEREEPVPFEGDPRSILAKVRSNMEGIVKHAAEEIYPDKEIKKIDAHFAPEVEFILIDKDYDFRSIHLDESMGNDHYYVPAREKVDETLKQITRDLSHMGLKREQYHTEVTANKTRTAGQYEVGIGHGNVEDIADGTMTLKYIISNVAERNGLRASFIPKFRAGVNGSGMHVHQNLAASFKNNKEANLFYDNEAKDGLSDMGRHYLAGLLKYAKEITAITNSSPISYKRLVPGCEAPTYIVWDWDNRTALCRGHSKGTKKIRVEYRSPDPLCNPHLAFAAMLSAGLNGIKEELVLSNPAKKDYYHDNDGVEELPANLGKALNLMNESEMLRENMGSTIIDNIYRLGSEKWRNYSEKVTDNDIKSFF